MEERKHHRTPKKITVTVKENPLDAAAMKYIKLFKSADKHQRTTKQIPQSDT